MLPRLKASCSPETYCQGGMKTEKPKEKCTTETTYNNSRKKFLEEIRHRTGQEVAPMSLLLEKGEAQGRPYYSTIA